MRRMSAPFSPVPVFVTAPSAILAVQRVIDDHGGFDAIVAKLHNGEPQAHIARQFGLTRADLRKWARHLPPEQSVELDEAERLGATAMMEDTIAIADTTAEKVEWDEASKPADLIKASAQRIGVRQFYAERRDKDKWSPRATTEVNLSFGSIFIDALRRRTRPDAEIPAHVLPEREETLEDFL